jgi:cytochrome c-type biogenesis protein CcmH/NrfF
MAGFNWLAWLTPFVALGLAGTVLAVVIRRRAATTASALATPTSAPGTDALRARLARELADFDRDA